MRGGRSQRIGDEARAAKLRAMGVPEEMILRQCSVREDFDIWPEHVSAVSVFTRLAATQWNVVAHMAGLTWIGLRYEAIPMVADALGIPAAERADLLWCVGVMESEAIRILNARGV